MRRPLPHQPHHHGGDDINNNEHYHHRRDLYNAACDLIDNHYPDVYNGAYYDRARAVHDAARTVLNDAAAYTVNLGPLDQLAAPINPAAVRVNIDGTTYRLTPDAASDEVTP